LILLIIAIITINLYKKSDTNEGYLPTTFQVMSIESEKNQLSEVVSNNDYNWVIYFDSKCGNCKEILKEVNEVGEGVKVILLTIEDTDTIKDLVNQIESRNVDAYQVSAKDIFKSFGSLRTPQVYLINKESKILEFKKVFEI
jgi:hypothetical protein